jgi:glycosyltransferase involved in cell wall biosynthesis
MTTPEISVILPFRNAGKTLAKSLASIARQTFYAFECVTIDNCATDDSADIAKDFCDRDARFKLITESSQGVVFAHNAGMKHAKGNFIARMDADDVMFPDRLEKQYSFLQQNKDVDVVAGQAEYVSHSKNTFGFQRYVEWSNSILGSKDIYLKRFIESPIINPTVMWRKEVSDQYGTYQHGEFPEDYELWLRWLDRGVKIAKLPFPIIQWVDSPKRLTRTDKRYSDLAFFNIKTSYLAKWLKTYNPHHPKVSVWGASRISRKRAQVLEEHGIYIQHFIDISHKRQLEKKVLHYEEIPDAGKIFILVYLKPEKMREETEQFLIERGYQEGRHFLLVS